MDTTTNRIHLRILDEPTGKGRARATRNGHHYTPGKTRSAEQFIRSQWETDGERTIDGPLIIDIILCCQRPQNHYNTKGELNALGLRTPHPHRRKPDVDNAAKLILDALEGYAYPADVAVISLYIDKRWAHQDEPACSYITIRPVTSDE